MYIHIVSYYSTIDFTKLFTKEIYANIESAQDLMLNRFNSQSFRDFSNRNL